MNERGSALVTVLWLLVILSTACAAVLSDARFGHLATSNRIVLRRAEWAVDACVETLMGRYQHAQGRSSAERPGSIDTMRLGGGTWCRAEVRGDAARIDINAVAPDLLAHVLASRSLADALVDWIDADSLPLPEGAERAWYRLHGLRVPRDGPLADLAELEQVRGFSPGLVRRLGLLFTAGGATAMDPNEAPEALLGLLPGIDASAVQAIMAYRARGTRIATMETFMELLPATSREAAQRQYLQLAQGLDLADATIHVEAEGGVTGWRPRAHTMLTMRFGNGRLAVLQRRAE